MPNDLNATPDIFVHDWLTGTTTRVSVATDGTEANDASWDPVIDHDGDTIAFSSWATNLLVGGSNGLRHVYVHQVGSGTFAVSIFGAELANAHAKNPGISGDGRWITFASAAGNVPGGDPSPGVEDVFLHDLQSGQTVVVPSATASAVGGADNPTLSNDGRYIAFDTDAGLLPADTNGGRDVYLYDTQDNAVIRISVAGDGSEVDAGSSFGVVSADGQVVVFGSSVADLVASDTNGIGDVFRRAW